MYVTAIESTNSHQSSASLTIWVWLGVNRYGDFIFIRGTRRTFSVATECSDVTVNIVRVSSGSDASQVRQKAEREEMSGETSC